MSEDHERSSHCCAAGCDATTDATKFSLVSLRACTASLHAAR